MAANSSAFSEGEPYSSFHAQPMVNLSKRSMSMTPTCGDDRAEEVGTLEFAGADEQSAVAAAGDGEFGGRGVLVGDEPFGEGDEVVEDILLASAGAGIVPGFAVFAAAAEAGLRVDAAHLHPHDVGGRELGHEGDVEAAVGVEQRGCGAVELRVPFCELMNMGTRVPSLLVVKTCLVS